MRKKHTPKGVLNFFKKIICPKKVQKKLSHKTVTLHCHCEANVKQK